MEQNNARVAGGEGRRVGEVVEVFGALVDMLVADFDLDTLLDEVARDAVMFLAVDGAAIMVARGQALEVVAATDDGARAMAQVQLVHGAGPGVRAARDAVPVVADCSEVRATWPEVGAAIESAGYAAVCALPLRQRTHAIGALNLFRSARGPLVDCDLQLAQALADMAAVGVAHHGRAHSAALVVELQQALTTRIVVEQAKGMIAEHAGLDMTAAFEILRSYARDHRSRVSAVARSLIDHEVAPGEIVGVRGPT